MERKKALLLSINSKYIHSSLGCWCLYTYAQKNSKNNFELKVIEGTINEKSDSILQRIIFEKPRIIAFSAYIWNISMVLSICEKVKELLPETIIILGGPEVSFNQVDVLSDNKAIDFIISGEGEKPFSDLLEALDKKKSYENIDGLSFHKNGKIIINPSAPFDMTESVSPYCEEYFACLFERIVYIESSRGCPFNCAFCLSGRHENVRYIDIERVKDEMILLCRHKAKTIKFVDRTFNCNKERALDILSFIKDNYNARIPDGVCFHFEIAADILDDKLLDKISEMPLGSVQFEVGIQSFNKDTLSAINRKNNLDKIILYTKKLISFGNCHIHTDLIAGLPFENYESFIDSFNKSYELKANMLQLGFLKVLHGSDIEKQNELYSSVYSAEPPYEVIETKWITDFQLDKLRLVEDSLDRLYNSGRFKNTLPYLLSSLDITPFDFFLNFSEYLKKNNIKTNIPLDRYTEELFNCFSAEEKIDKSVFRDKLITDRISTNSSCIIPKALQIKDERLRRIKLNLRNFYPEKPGEKRCVAILYSEDTVIFCDYQKRNPVTGEYEYKKIPLTDVI